MIIWKHGNRTWKLGIDFPSSAHRMQPLKVVRRWLNFCHCRRTGEGIRRSRHITHFFQHYELLHMPTPMLLRWESKELGEVSGFILSDPKSSLLLVGLFSSHQSLQLRLRAVSSFLLAHFHSKLTFYNSNKRLHGVWESLLMTSSSGERHLAYGLSLKASRTAIFKLIICACHIVLLN